MTLRERYGFIDNEPVRDNAYTPEEVISELDLDIKANRRLLKMYLDMVDKVVALTNENESLKQSTNIQFTLAKILSVVETQATTVDILVNDISGMEDTINDIESTVSKIDSSIGEPGFNRTVFSAIEDIPKSM